MQFNGPGKKESRKVVGTKICFYGSTKIEQKIKVWVIKKQGFCCQDDQNPMLTSKLLSLLNISIPY